MIHSSIRLSDDDEARSYGAEFTKKQEIESKGKPVDFSPGKDYYHWYHENEKVKKFYKKFFSHIEISPKTEIPKKTNFVNRIQFVPYELTIQEICEAYKKKFGDNQIFSPSKSQDLEINPVRPNKDYFYAYLDIANLKIVGTSYNLSLEQKAQITNTKEYILADFMHRYETGERYDLKTSTILSTLIQTPRGKEARVMYTSKHEKFMFPHYTSLNATEPNMGYRIIELA